jgi:CRP/FNR family transcriptional regulator, cyclic AMP receptor protein
MWLLFTGSHLALPKAAEFIGYAAATLVFLTFYIKVMVPLRIVAICSNCAFIAYGYLDSLYPVLFLHIVLLPLNVIRLRQMIELSLKVREAAHGDLNMDWIRPFSVIKHIRTGEILFKRGELATNMFVIVSGRFQLKETGIEVGPGHVVGELSLLAPKHRRTLTLECLESGEVFCMSFGQLQQLFFQNQNFGFFFLKLIASRMSENLESLEHTLAEREQEIRALRKAGSSHVETGRLAKVS